jgi:hypothetical protein
VLRIKLLCVLQSILLFIGKFFAKHFFKLHGVDYCSACVMVVKVYPQFLDFWRNLIDCLGPRLQLLLAVKIVVPEPLVAAMQAYERVIGGDDGIGKEL